MFVIPMESSKSRKSRPISGPPSRIGSFAVAASHSGLISNSAGRASYSSSGHVTSVSATRSASVKKSNSGPLNKHGDPIKKSSGP